MTALPASSEFTDGTRTEAQMKTTFSNQREYLAGLMGTDGLAATALASLGSLASVYLAKTGAYTVTTADRGRIIDATSGTWTLTLPAAAIAGAGFSFHLRNMGSGTITVDPSGAELIDGAATIAVSAGSGALVIGTGTAWITLGHATPTASATDTTAGRLLKVGGFGLGASLSITDFTAALSPGIYTYLETTAVGAPGTGASYYGHAIVTKNTSGGGSVLAFRGSPNANLRAWIGYRGAGTGAFTWIEIPNLAAAVRTVSQSGGVPTGGLFERGSNANGSYTRFADGTQICEATLTVNQAITTSLLGGFRNAGQTWTFPSAFSAAPVLSGVAGSVNSFGLIMASPSATACSVWHTAVTSQAGALDLTGQVTAIGTWF